MSSHQRGSQLPVSRIASVFPAVAFILLLTAMTTACDSGSDPAAEEWLHGTWELTFNPERDSEDALVFNRNGFVQVHTANKRVIDGSYQMSSNTLLIVLVVNDQPVDVRFEISPDKSRLVYENGAYYTKKGASAP